ncbi:hypothetical protein NDU88_005193 [Pleurodeles waltl]|uniref:Uncharacterized protein n=1 Tax=Pleurodeles waltl TaxID=8319 RepID=A0AAV7ULD7_PLEWA|nr:hypothetical protein NDU88_005193 [Pleurodeles waltl]
MEGVNESEIMCIYLEPLGKEIGRKRRRKLKPLNRLRLLEVMGKCLSLYPTCSDKLHEELLTAAHILQIIFPRTEGTARDRAFVRILDSLSLFYINGRINIDRPAKQTFRFSDQAFPIECAFINAWYFGEVVDFEVLHLEGSNHWPLQLTLGTRNNAKRESVVALQVEYPRRITTEIIEDRLKVLNEQMVNYRDNKVKEDLNDVFMGYDRVIEQVADYLKVKIKMTQENTVKGQVRRVNKNIWYN